MLALLLAASVTIQSPLATRTVRPENGPEVRVHDQAGPIVALRLSAPISPEFPEGAVELLLELARPEAAATAHRFGARYTLRREGDRAVVTASGPASAFDAMVALLRRATGPPDLTVASLRRARARAEDRVLAEVEQPGPRIRQLLWLSLYGGSEARVTAVTQLGPEPVRALRAHLYDPAELHVVMVGSVPDVVIRSAFADWPGVRAPGPLEPIAADTTGAPGLGPAHREWGGVAFPVEGDAATLAVAAELVRQRMSRSTLRYGAVEVWYGPAPALALIGAASPGDSVVEASAGISDLVVRDSVAVPRADMRRYLRRLVAEAAALAGPDAVAAARSAVLRRWLLEARTAAGKAEVIGRLADQLGPDGSPDAYLRRLGSVRLADVRELLDEVLETPAAVAGR